MHFHSQNLNDKYVAGRTVYTAPKWRHGRAWWYLTQRLTLSWEWGFFRSSVGSAIGLRAKGDEGQLTWHVAITWLFSLYFTVTYPPLLRLLRLDWESAKAREARTPHRVTTLMGEQRHEAPVPAVYDMDRDLSLRFFDRGVWWTLWYRDDYSRSSDPKWRRGCWHYLDTLLGKTKYSREVLASEFVEVPLPEKRYPALVKLDKATWKRPRWPKATVRYGAHVEFNPKDSPPVPGKGENSWDCGPDAIQALSIGDVTTIQGAVIETVNRVLKSRVRNGGALDYAERE